MRNPTSRTSLPLPFLQLALLPFLSLPATSTPATADPVTDTDDRPCVTRTEQRLVDDGWRKRRVHRVFDTKGSAVLARADSSAAILRHYPACNGTHTVHVQYQSTDEDPRWRVTHVVRSKNPTEN